MILLAAATPWEAGPLLRRWRLQPEAAGRHRGAVAGAEIILLETGMGPERARRALEELAGESPSAAISTGFAGALQPGIRSGDLVADLRGAPLEWVGAARELAAARKRTLHLGRFYSTDRVLADPAQKRAAGERERAVAVDMESGALRAWCRERGSAFVGLRVVLDAVGERLPEGTPENGSAAALLRYAAGRWKELPLLMSLWLRQARGMAALGLFLDSFIGELERGQKA